MTDYEALFARNYGVFTAAEQERIREACILITGVGGIGGTVAVELARAGCEKFILVDFDTYAPSNMNRQVACFHSSLGRSKVEVIAETIRDINPAARLEVIDRRLSHSELEPYLTCADVVFPAADDFAYSMLVFRRAQQLNTPALMVMPSGDRAQVSMVMPGSPPTEAMGALPRLETYEELHRFLNSRRSRLAMSCLVPRARWRPGYFAAFLESDVSHAQLCPVVWLSSSLGALEILKVLTGRWKAVTLPRYWDVRPEGIRITSLWGLNRETPRRLLLRLCRPLLVRPHTPLLEQAMERRWHIQSRRWLRQEQRRTTRELKNTDTRYYR